MILTKRQSEFKKWLIMNLKFERILLDKIENKLSKEYRNKLEQINILQNGNAKG